jgi:hypothetical protein
MKYVELPPLTKNEVEDILSDKEATLEQKYTAFQSAIRHGNPEWSLPLLEKLMFYDNFEIVAPGLALLSMTVRQHKIVVRTAPLYRWLSRYEVAYPDNKGWFDEEMREVEYYSNLNLKNQS